jgi:hypothetical protein
MIVGSGNGGIPANSSSPLESANDVRKSERERRNRSSVDREIESFLQTASMSRRTSLDAKSKDMLNAPLMNSFDAL